MSRAHDYPMLHIWAQDCEHGEAYIIANRMGLIALRNLLNKAFEQAYLMPAGSENFTAVDSFFVNDGEGFYLAVHAVDDRGERVIAVPYTAESAQENRENAVYPYDISAIREAIRQEHIRLQAEADTEKEKKK